MSDSDFSDFSDEENSYYSSGDESETQEVELPAYECINQEDILKSIESEIENFRSRAEGVSKARARLLLQENQWNVDLALQAMNQENNEQANENIEEQMRKLKIDLDGSDLECEVCLQTVSAQNMKQLGCGHSFCVGCLRDTFVENISNMMVNISCPACEYLMSSEFVIEMLSEDFRAKYLRLLSQSYVDKNNQTVWCPGTDCDLAIRGVNFKDCFNVECRNGHQSCFKCKNAWHDPVSCDQLKKWLKKCQDTSETDNWVAANTKECPKCTVSTYKDGGCNHVRCTQCGKHWCWICFKEWGEHDCTVPVEGRNVSDSRAALER